MRSHWRCRNCIRGKTLTRLSRSLGLTRAWRQRGRRFCLTVRWLCSTVMDVKRFQPVRGRRCMLSGRLAGKTWNTHAKNAVQCQTRTNRSGRPDMRHDNRCLLPGDTPGLDGLVVTGAMSVPAACPIERSDAETPDDFTGPTDRKSTRLNSSHLGISYAVF